MRHFRGDAGRVDRLLAATDADLVRPPPRHGPLCLRGRRALERAEAPWRPRRYLHLKDARESELRHVRASDVSMAEAWNAAFLPAPRRGGRLPRVIETLRGDTGTWAGSNRRAGVVPTRRDASSRPSDRARKSRNYLRDQAGGLAPAADALLFDAEASEDGFDQKFRVSTGAILCHSFANAPS